FQKSLFQPRLADQVGWFEDLELGSVSGISRPCIRWPNGAATQRVSVEGSNREGRRLEFCVTRCEVVDLLSQIVDDNVFYITVVHSFCIRYSSLLRVHVGSGLTRQHRKSLLGSIIPRLENTGDFLDAIVIGEWKKKDIAEAALG